MDATKAKAIVLEQFCRHFDGLKSAIQVQGDGEICRQKEMSRHGRVCRKMAELLTVQDVVKVVYPDYMHHQLQNATLFKTFCVGLDVSLEEDWGDPGVLTGLELWLPRIAKACRRKLIRRLFYAQGNVKISLGIYLACKSMGLEQAVVTRAAEKVVIGYWLGWLAAEVISVMRSYDEVLPVVKKVILAENLKAARLEQLAQETAIQGVETKTPWSVENMVDFICRVKLLEIKLPALSPTQLVPTVQQYVEKVVRRVNECEGPYWDSHDAAERTLPFVVQIMTDLVPKSEHPNFVINLVNVLKKTEDFYFYSVWVAGLMKELRVDASLVYQFFVSNQRRQWLVKELEGPPELLQDIKLAEKREESLRVKEFQESAKKRRKSSQEEKERLAKALALLKKMKK